MNVENRQRPTAKNESSNGLVVKDFGLQGLIFETSPAHRNAVARHARVVTHIDSNTQGPPGGRLLLLLVLNDMILTLVGLKSAVSINAKIYEASEVKYLEWPMGIGWIDRRELSQQTIRAIRENDGCVVTNRDWQWASASLRELHPQRRSNEIWREFIADAQAWWYPNLSGPLLGMRLAFVHFKC